MSDIENKYRVSIRFMCYNHENFKEAMDGIMMQETKFKVAVEVEDNPNGKYKFNQFS